MTLTAAGYLPPALVAEIMQTLGWHTNWVGASKREVITVPVSELRAAAATGTWLGALFEPLVTQSVRVYASSRGATVGHLRTKDTTREIGLVVEGEDRRVVAIEVKLAASVTDADVRHLHWLRERLGDRVADLVVVTTGPLAYRRPDGVAVVPLALLGR